MDITFDMSDFMNGLKEAKAEIERKKIIALTEGAEFILGETIPVTPKSPQDFIKDVGLPGDLRKSGNTQLEKRFGELVGLITFGDGRVDYAVHVHEMPDDTNYSEPGTGNKYLEKTIRAKGNECLKLMARRIKL